MVKLLLDRGSQIDAKTKVGLSNKQTVNIPVNKQGITARQDETDRRQTDKTTGTEKRLLWGEYCEIYDP